MKKLFTLAAAVLFSIGLWAQHETVFEFSFTGTVSENEQTATGGTVYVGRPGSVASDTHVASGYAMKLDGDPAASNTKYLRVDLQENSSLQEGDTVYVSGYGGNTPSEGQSFVVSADRAAETRYAVLQPTVKNTEQNLYFVVTDAAKGLNATSFYISRNSVSLYLSGVAVYRPAPASDPVTAITISGDTVGYAGETLTLTATPDIKADTIWWTNQSGQKQASKDGVFKFTPDEAGEYTFTAWAENSHNENPVTKAQKITVKPAVCAALYPAASGDALSVGSTVALTDASSGGSIKVTGMKNSTSIQYNAAGLQLGGGGADSILVTLGNYIKEGTIIELTMQSGGDSKTRGLNILANNVNVYEATWAVASASEVKKISYTVPSESALIGLYKFGLQRHETVYLKSVKVANCGAEVQYTITVADNIENGTIVADKAQATAGEKVVITATPTGTYKTALVTVNGTPLALDGEEISFNMPAEDVVIDGEFTQSGWPTAVDNTVDNAKAIKTIENGQLVIIKNGVRYNVLGAELR